MHHRNTFLEGLLGTLVCAAFIGTFVYGLLRFFLPIPKHWWFIFSTFGYFILRR